MHDHMRIITCYFNPAWYSRPLENYHLFARVAPLTVELALGGAPHLIIDSVKLRSQSTLWHKESLLNHALSLLPDCDKVIVSDADILFPPDSFELISESLDRFDVVQGFETAYRLYPEQKEFSRFNPQGYPLTPEKGVVASREAPNSAYGFVWAFRTEFLREVGLYERGILGGGDTLLYNALAGNDQPAYLPSVYDDVMAWTEKVRSLNPRVGYSPNEICHLWHGDLKNRGYADRHEILVRHGFDPLSDLKKVGGVLEWASQKPALHQDVRDYFLGRREDG